MEDAAKHLFDSETKKNIPTFFSPPSSRESFLATLTRYIDFCLCSKCKVNWNKEEKKLAFNNQCFTS